MVYSLKKIELLTKALRGDKATFAMLMSEFPEYAALGSALVGNVAAMNWLLKHNKTLAVFADAVDGNKSAVQILMKGKLFELAAVANMLNDDEKAKNWLKHYRLKPYLEFADAIQHAINKELQFDLSGYFTLYG